MEMTFVLCRILTESFCIIWINWVLKCPWHSLPLTKKAHIPSQVCPCGICGKQRGTGTFIHIFILHLNTTIKRRTSRQSLGIFKAVLYFSYKEVYDRKVLTHFSILQGIIWCLGCDPSTRFPCCWQPFTVASTTGYKLTHQSNYMESSPFWESVIAHLFEFLLLCWVWNFHDHIHKTLLLISVMSQKNVHFCHPVSSRSVLIFPSQQCLGIQSGILTQ